MRKNKPSAAGLRKIITLLLVVVLAPTIFSFCGKSRREVKQPRLVILYATCTVNKNYLSPYNSSISYTPNFEKFAEKSLVFTNYVTEIGQSGPAYASIFSGTQSDKHGVYNHPRKLSSDLYLVSEFYNENGYETFFWNRHRAASAALNYGQGVRKENTFRNFLEGDSPDFLRVLRKLEKDKDYRAFVLTNFSVTHAPYSITHLPAFQKQYPAELDGLTDEDIKKYYTLYRENSGQLTWNFPEAKERLKLSEKDILMLSRVLEVLYKTNINYLDTIFGNVMEKIEKAGLLDESLIVFTADHGEVLYRENSLFKWTHGGQLAPEVLNVPLMIHSPALNGRPGVYKRIARSVDVFPTMIGLSGLSSSKSEKLADIQGMDLSPPVLGLDPAPILPAYSHTGVLGKIANRIKNWTLFYNIRPRQDPKLMWVSLKDEGMIYKLISLDTENWKMVVFDLKNDPGETENLFEPGNATHREFLNKLRTYKKRLVKNYYLSSSKKAKNISREREIQILKSLGYIH